MKLHVYLTAENHFALLEYCLKNIDGWTDQMEHEVIFVASYYRNMQILDTFVLNPKLNFRTDRSDRIRSMFCGLGATCQQRYIELSLDILGTPTDPLKEGPPWPPESPEIDEFMSQSLLCCVLAG